MNKEDLINKLKADYAFLTECKDTLVVYVETEEIEGDLKYKITAQSNVYGYTVNKKKYFFSKKPENPINGHSVHVDNLELAEKLANKVAEHFNCLVKYIK